MKAVVLETPGPIEQDPITVTEIPRPEPGPGQLVMKVAACGVCRSNLHMVEGDWAPDTPSHTPIVPGHEVVGTVAEVGPGVTRARVGDRVGVQPLWSTCGWCEFCVSGRDQLCRSTEITGETVDGGYAEYMLADERHTYLLPDELSFADAAPLFCPGITAYGSTLKARPAPGRSVAVFGVGGVGHLVLQLVKLFGADVYGVSRGEQHLRLTEELGGVGVESSTAAETFARRGGVDAAVVFAPSDDAVQQALHAVKPGGTVVLGVNATLGPLPFATEKVVVGSVLGSRHQMRTVLGLAAAGKIRAHCEPFALDEAAIALNALKQGEVRARAVLVM